MYTTLQNLREEFIKATKTVLKENISSNPSTLDANRDRITNAYNLLINEIRHVYPKSTEKDKSTLIQLFNTSREKVARAYATLNCPYYIPDNIEHNIDKSAYSFVHQAENPCHSNPNISTTSSKFNLNLPSTSFSEPPQTCDSVENSTTSNQKNNPVDINPNNINAMADLSPVEFLKLCSSTINKNFSGDPLTLQSFIDSIELLQTMATNINLMGILVKFVRCKLEGKARESINETHITIGEIINQLKNKIKCENSKVIEGRMQALRADRVPLQDFSAKADALAESFRRALVMEGIPSEKAQEMTIDKTVEMCRASARSDLAKAVLASSSFKDPKEVVAKFLVEISSESKEKQVLAFKSQKGKHYQNNKNKNNNTNKNYHSRNNNSNNRQYNQNNRQNSYSHNNNNQHNRYNSRNNSNYSRSNNSQYQYNSNQPRQNIRYMENSVAPQWQQNQQRLGEEEQFSNQSYQQQ